MIEFDMEQKITKEIANSKEAVQDKVKHYEEMLIDISRKNEQKHDMERNQIVNLKAELEAIQETQKVIKTQALTSVNSEPKNTQKDNYNELTMQLEELKFSYDELKDEKEQLYFSLKELREKNNSGKFLKKLLHFTILSNCNLIKDDSSELIKQLNSTIATKDRIISSYEAKNNNSSNFSSFLDRKSSASSDNNLSYLNTLTNYKHQNASNRSLMTELSDGETSRMNSSSQYLEQTEIDYLKSIVYSYMMGTDPIVRLIQQRNY